MSKRAATRWLWAARLIWLTMTLVSLVIFARGVPVFVEALRETYGANFGLSLQRSQADELILIPDEGGQAAQAGVMERDVLVAVDDVPVSVADETALDDLVPEGAAGTAVSLQIRTGERPLREITLVRGDRAGAWLNRFNVPVAAVVAVAAGVELLVTLGFIAVAALIFWRGAQTPIVWLSSLVLILVFTGAGSLPVQNLYFAELDWQVWLDVWFSLMVTALLLFLFLFPNGRFVPRWAVVLLPLSLAWIAAAWVWPDLYFWRLDSQPYLLMLAIFLLAGVAAQLWRYRHQSSPQQRQQTKWMVWGISVALTAVFIQFAAGLLLPLAPLLFDLLINPLTRLAQLIIPITFAFAIFQRRLWEIDLIVNRTLVYGGLTALITALYVLLVGVAGSLAVTERGNLAAFVVATVVVLLGIRPLHRRLQKQVDRLLPSPPQTTQAKPRRKTTRTTLLQAAWTLNALVAVSLFGAGLTFQAKHGFGQMPPAEALTSVPLLASLPAGNNPLLQSSLYPFALMASYIQAAAFVGVGLFFFWRRSRELMVVLASAMLIAVGLGFTPTIVFLPLLKPTWHLPTTLFQAGLFSSVFLFLCLFPNGRFFPDWSRYAAAVWLGYTLLWLPFPQLNLHRATTVWPPLFFVAVVFLGIGFQVIRYRRLSASDEKQQTKWVIVGFAAANFGLFFVALLIGLQPVRSTAFLGTAMLLLGMASSLIPLTISVALFRYRLWEIDVIINRTLVFGGLSLGIVAIYVLVVGALGALFQAQGNFVFALLATGLIAVLFQPVRERLQRGVNRLMFGERDDPYGALSKLGAQLQTTATPEAMLQSVVETIAATLKLPYVSIDLADEQGQLGGAATGKAVAATVDLPLRYQSETVGQLVVSPRSPGEAFTEREQRLLADMAAQTGAMAYSVRLTAALQRSREKLVLTREEERRRIRRDLHDGLGPTLASQTFAFDAILELMETNPSEAAHLLRGLKAQNQETVTEIRRLVYELRPPALDELGLLGALQAHVGQLSTRSAFSVQIKATPDPLPPLSAAVEVAAYRIALEAITNVVRHAQARQCKVEIELAGNGRSTLQITITDDGIGLPPVPQPGVGLHAMRERAEELGGSVLVAKQETGTRVTAVLPLSPQSELTNQ